MAAKTEKSAVEAEAIETVNEEAVENIEQNTAEQNAVDESAEGFTEEEMFTAFKELLAKVSHRSKAFIPATGKAEKREIRGQAIISDTDETLTTTDALKQDMLELNASAHSGKVLKGRIIGCRKAGESNISTNLAVVQYGNGTCEVLIPDYLLFNYEVKEVRDAAQQKKLENRMVRMIGADISFVVKRFEQKERQAYADRLKALEQEGYNNYVRQLNGTNHPRVRVGDIVKGQVTAVYKNRITVCALGSETTIYQDQGKGITEVSWYHLSDLSMQFKKNMIVPCKVMNVQVVEVNKYGERYNMVVTELSVKRCEDNPQEKYFDNYKPGQFCECIITNVNESANGLYGIINGVGKVDCMIAYPAYGEIPKVGETRTIKITDMVQRTDKGLTHEPDGTPVRRIYAVLADI